MMGQVMLAACKRWLVMLSLHAALVNSKCSVLLACPHMAVACALMASEIAVEVEFHFQCHQCDQHSIVPQPMYGSLAASGTLLPCLRQSTVLILQEFQRTVSFEHGPDGDEESESDGHA